jgi:hypothetical protein
MSISISPMIVRRSSFALRFIIVAGITLLRANPLPAYADNVTTFVFMTGECNSISAMNVATDPRRCDNKIVNVEYPNGRVGFVFTLKKSGQTGAVISFFGDGVKQIHLDPNTVSQPVDRVHFTFQGSTDDFVAVGSCRFGNPYLGRPSTVVCSADTKSGSFKGAFTSNGDPPDMTQQ